MKKDTLEYIKARANDEGSITMTLAEALESALIGQATKADVIAACDAELNGSRPTAGRKGNEMITRLQPTISVTGIRYILDNEGREITTVSSLLDGKDNAARAKEEEYIHNEICKRFNRLPALRAERDELREALEDAASLLAHTDKYGTFPKTHIPWTTEAIKRAALKARAVLAKYAGKEE